MKHFSILLLSGAVLCTSCTNEPATSQNTKMQFAAVDQVEINDSFWSPKYKLWRETTAHDVLNKFEGQHIEDASQKHKHDAFYNFDQIAKGVRNDGEHAGPPWYDGLIFETTRGIADFIRNKKDPSLERRLDGYIDRIYAAQENEGDGYINTYTMRMYDDRRWGDNGGFLQWQHDVYNAGMLIEAGIHYYEATGKTKLLTVATRFANHMCELMGPEPKRNIVPSHSGPEEPMVRLYWLYRDNPSLKQQVGVPVNEKDYFDLVTFWIEQRGKHCGYPLRTEWGHRESEKWIREGKYNDPKFGNHSRPSWDAYAQDSIPVFEQKTIEGHAVRATLLATGVATVALENNSEQYINSACALWDNMIGKRMAITGGVGAIHMDEKFGPDYYLPNDAYLETCAGVGSGFFSQRMFELLKDGKYMDELERVLYNNIIVSVGLDGVSYTYVNPLNADKQERWDWHGCPCCPPMFFKIISAVPGYIYSHTDKDLYVNLFIGSQMEVNMSKNLAVKVKQETEYPWDGIIQLAVDPSKKSRFNLKIRIPGWAEGQENPYGLYYSKGKPGWSIRVNGETQNVAVQNGYAEINREWNKGDKVVLDLPMQPRVVHAHRSADHLTGLVSLASGPVVYCMEEVDNKQLESISIQDNTPLQIEYRADLLNGVNVIKGQNNGTSFMAVPYYSIGNRAAGAHKVWLPVN